MKRFVPLLVPALIAAALAASPAGAGATQITVESRTFLPAREDGNSGKHVTPYEYLDLGAEDIALPGLYIRAGGWGRVDLGDASWDRRTNGELQYGYIGYRAPLRNAELRLGRVSVTGGTARNEWVDGAQASADLGAGFDFLAYGGVPVETTTGGRSGDSIWGGRVSQGLLGVYRLGLSYLREKDNSADSRQEAGVDLWLRPGLPIVFTGSSLYNAENDKFARHSYRASLEPIAFGLRATVRYTYTDYRQFFTFPAANPFLFPQIDLDETLQTIGGDLELPLPSGFTLIGDYTNYDYQIAAAAQRYGARLDWSATKGLKAGLGYHYCRGDAAENRYAEYAAYGSAHAGPVLLALSLQELRFKEEINGTKDAFTATLSAETELTPKLSLGADVEYGTNPDYKSEVRGMLKVTWRYSLDTAKKGGTE